MGTWGVGIFDDDTALDVQAGFRELIAAGWSSEDATERLCAEYDFSEAGGDEIAADWIALAVTQWRTGRLLDSVKTRALEGIAAETAERWDDPQLWRKRQRVLQKTVATLDSPQRAPARIKCEPVAESPYEAGDIVRFTLDSGREVALWALTKEHHMGLTRTSVNNAFVMLAFGDPTLDPVEQLVARRPPVMTNPPSETAPAGYSYISQLHLWLPQDATGPRWALIGNSPVPEAHSQPSHFQLVHLRKRPGTADAHAQRAFQYLYEASLRSPSPRNRALLDLADCLPALPGLWNSHFHMIPRDAAIALADKIGAGETEPARRMLAIADRQLELAKPVRRVGLALIDKLLNIASHPETPVTRDQILPLLGPHGRELVAAIDAAWEAKGGSDRWEELDSQFEFVRTNAFADSRLLSDGTYAIVERHRRTTRSEPGHS